MKNVNVLKRKCGSSFLAKRNCRFYQLQITKVIRRIFPLLLLNWFKFFMQLECAIRNRMCWRAKDNISRDVIYPAIAWCTTRSHENYLYNTNWYVCIYRSLSCKEDILLIWFYISKCSRFDRISILNHPWYSIWLEFIFFCQIKIIRADKKHPTSTTDQRIL